jgi:hypothetical protein
MSVLAAALALSVTGRVEAHATSTSYLVADATNGDDVRVTWGVSVADLNWSMGLDSDGDGLITWGEVDGRGDEIAAFVASHLDIARGGVPCMARFDDLAITAYAGEPHLSLGFRASCAADLMGATRATDAGVNGADSPAANATIVTLGPNGASSSGPAGARPTALTLAADLFFDTTPTQRTLVDIVTLAGQFTSVLSPESRKWVEPAAPSMLATFTTFVGQGLWHVWVGYDHLAFLVLLLLPGVLRSTGAGWQGVGTLRDTARDLLSIITAFTLAHSITLALAATGTVQVPVRPIEIAIAASIVIAGLLNLFPAAAKARLALAFGFGLIHGFGFANALAELGTGGVRLIPTLAGFNVGVELAQLSLVLLVLPALFRARNSTFYSGRFMPVTSLVAALTGAAWLVARAS